MEDFIKTRYKFSQKKIITSYKTYRDTTVTVEVGYFILWNWRKILVLFYITLTE